MIKKLIPLALLLAFPALAQFEVGSGSEATPTSPDTAMPAGKVTIDRTTIPNRRAAWSVDRLEVYCTGAYGTTCTGSSVPEITDSSDGVLVNGGQFRLLCPVSHVAFDDPIVWPKVTGRTHLHQFFGNTSTRASSNVLTFETVGDSTCGGGTINRSAYWTPVMIYHCEDPVDLAAGICNPALNGKVLYATGATFYYKTTPSEASAGPSSNAGSWGGAPMQWPPAGFNMITGNTNNAVTAAQSSSFDFYCVRANADIASYDHIPTSAEANAAGGCDEIKMTAGFPRCWNNVDLGTPTGKGHMAVGHPSSTSGCTGNVQELVGALSVVSGANYPILFPGISTNIAVYLSTHGLTDDDLDYIRLSSDLPKAEARALGGNCTSANNWCAGRTNHSDWINGWSTALVVPSVGAAWGMSITDAILDQCYHINNNPLTPLQSDCHDNLMGSPLGDNRWWGLF
jgi:hypothetical protein